MRTFSADASDIRTRVNDSASAFLSWWGRELAACIPAKWRSAWSPDARYTVLRLTEDKIELRDVTHARGGISRREHLIRTCDLTEVGHSLDGKSRRLNGISPLYLRVPLSRCLQRHVTVPTAAQKRLDAILALDLERATPFKRTDVFSGWLPPNTATNEAASLRVTHIVLKASIIQPLLQIMDIGRVRCSGVEVETSDGDILPIRLKRGGASDNDLPPLLARLNDATRLLALGLILVSAASVALSLHRQEQALATVRAETAALQKRATMERQRQNAEQAAQNEAVSLRRRKLETKGFLQILEDVSRVLPDDAWVNELQFSDDGIVIDGQAHAAAELIGLLSAAPDIREVSFLAPVTRDPGKALERFRIRFKTAPVPNERR